MSLLRAPVNGNAISICWPFVEMTFCWNDVRLFTVYVHLLQNIAEEQYAVLLKG